MKAKLIIFGVGLIWLGLAHATIYFQKSTIKEQSKTIVIYEQNQKQFIKADMAKETALNRCLDINKENKNQLLNAQNQANLILDETRNIKKSIRLINEQNKQKPSQSICGNTVIDFNDFNRVCKASTCDIRTSY